MTIAAGFVCNEGVVIAADSHETLTEYTKGSRAKVILSLFPATEGRKGYLTYACAGSGWSDYIETAREELSNALGGCTNYLQAASAIDEWLRTFHEKRIAPWAAFSPAQQPYVELLIGLSVGTASGLFHCTGTSSRRCGEHIAIGSGAILANSLISTYTQHGDDLERLARLAVYIIHKVKKHAEGCGGFTQVVALRKDGDFSLVDGIEGLEAEIDNIEKKSVEGFRSQIFASPTMPRIRWLTDVSGTRSRKRRVVSSPSEANSLLQEEAKTCDQRPPRSGPTESI